MLKHEWLRNISELYYTKKQGAGFRTLLVIQALFE